MNSFLDMATFFSLPALMLTIPFILAQTTSSPKWLMKGSVIAVFIIGLMILIFYRCNLAEVEVCNSGIGTFQLFLISLGFGIGILFGFLSKALSLTRPDGIQRKLIIVAGWMLTMIIVCGVPQFF
jgi:hypothetical protein